MSAEGDATVYNHFKERIMHGDHDLISNALNMILVGAGYTFSQDGNQGYADTAITANEITAAGYTAGGTALTGKSISQDDAGDQGEFDAANVVWTSLGATTIAHAILYDDVPTAPVADPLLIRWEIGTNANGGNYTLDLSSKVLIIS